MFFGALVKCRRVQQARRIHSVADLVNLASKRSGFGSFHSDDVGVLINDKDLREKMPMFYMKLEESLRIPFTSNLKICSTDVSTLFNLDSRFRFMNHGAFGLALSRLLVTSNSLK